MKKGFTLIELSIVLVIIGLLIGGILAARSLITTTQIQAVVRQIGQTEAAIRTFHLKFNSIPGDSLIISNMLGSGGDNDNLLEDDMTYNPDSEAGTFWWHIRETQSIRITDEKCPPGYSSGVGLCGPSMSFSDNATLMAIGNYGTPALVPFPNYFVIADLDSCTAGVDFIDQCISGVMERSFVLAIDVKMDNGDLDQGIVSATEGGDDGTIFLNGVSGTFRAGYYFARIHWQNIGA